MFLNVIHAPRTGRGAEGAAACMDETEETGVAFRAGVKGLPFIDKVGPQPDLVVKSDPPPGANEQYLVSHLSEAGRIPGLSETVSAYETGRALRCIGYVLDNLGISVENCAGSLIQYMSEATVWFKLKNERQPWGAADTAFVFSGVLPTLGVPEADVQKIEQSIIQYAQRHPTREPR